MIKSTSFVNYGINPIILQKPFIKVKIGIKKGKWEIYPGGVFLVMLD